MDQGCATLLCTEEQEQLYKSMLKKWLFCYKPPLHWGAGSCSLLGPERIAYRKPELLQFHWCQAWLIQLKGVQLSWATSLIFLWTNPTRSNHCLNSTYLTWSQYYHSLAKRNFRGKCLRAENQSCFSSHYLSYKLMCKIDHFLVGNVLQLGESLCFDGQVWHWLGFLTIIILMVQQHMMEIRQGN